MSDSAQARARSARVVAAVLGGESLQTALVRNVAKNHAAQVQALCYGTLRWHVRLDALLTLLLDRPLKKRNSLLRALLLVGLHELNEGKTPEHAVVTETVNACQQLRQRHAGGLVNAVLRRFLRERQSLEQALNGQDAVSLAQPAWLHAALVSDWPDDWRSIAEASNAHPPMWLRVNSRLSGVPDYAQRLEQECDIRTSTHPFAQHALCLDRPLPANDLPGFAEGLVSVQDAAAQIAAPLLNAQAGEHVLDACAAPGGKTAHIAELSDCKATVVALDISSDRLIKVSESLARLRLSNVSVIEGDAGTPEQWWDGAPFDRILLDAPCSATGVIRRHPDIRILRRPGDIPVLAGQQLRMLSALWSLLKPGGHLVYATCSVLRAENERPVSAFLHATRGATAERLPALMPGRPAGAGQQILPGETGMDGFYYACLRKGGID